MANRRVETFINERMIKTIRAGISRAGRGATRLIQGGFGQLAVYYFKPR